MSWSPNGKWIVLHSPASGLTTSGRGWLAAARPIAACRAWAAAPKWDGRGGLRMARVPFGGTSSKTGQGALFVIGIDQESGAVTSQSREVAVSGNGEIVHGEWPPDSATFVAIGKEGPGRHAILSAPAAGGRAHVVHRFESEHDFPGLAGYNVQLRVFAT